MRSVSDVSGQGKGSEHCANADELGGVDVMSSGANGVGRILVVSSPNNDNASSLFLSTNKLGSLTILYPSAWSLRSNPVILAWLLGKGQWRRTKGVEDGDEGKCPGGDLRTVERVLTAHHIHHDVLVRR